MPNKIEEKLKEWKKWRKNERKKERKRWKKGKEKKERKSEKKKERNLQITNQAIELDIQFSFNWKQIKLFLHRNIKNYIYFKLNTILKCF